MLSPAEEIKSRLDILEVIQGYLKLHKAGSNWKGLCPFHSEKTPSFMVSPSRQMWHCFGCAKGGDIFTFVSDMEGIEFADALRILAERAGVKLSRQDPQIQSQRHRIYEICELATKFFERQLVSRAGQAAEAYLQERGVHKKTIDYFRLGWAPDSWQSLRDFLNSEGYKDEEINQAGLIVESENQSYANKKTERKYHDRFRHRVMFPICDTQEQVIGFSGRLFDKAKGQTVHADAGKYVNTPNTLLYDKSHALYGLDKAKMAIKQEGGCVVVEGNLDVILSHQAGVRNTVAACGTAFGQDHFKIIKRYTDKLLLAFDLDEAGDAALKRSVMTALANNFNVMVVEMPFGKDTADVVKEKPQLWLEAVLKPVPYLESIFNKALAKFNGGDLVSKKAVLATVMPFIKSLASPLDRDYWLDELADKIKVDKNVLASELKLAQLPHSEISAAMQVNVPIASYESSAESPIGLQQLRQEEYLMALLIKYPNVLRKHISAVELDLFSQPNLVTLGKSLIAGEAANLESLDSSIILASDLLEDFVIDPEAEFLKVLNSLKRQSIQSKLKIIEADIKKAEVEKDLANLKLLLDEFNILSQKLNEL